jgi:hypothetical protein
MIHKAFAVGALLAVGCISPEAEPPVVEEAIHHEILSVVQYASAEPGGQRTGTIFGLFDRPQLPDPDVGTCVHDSINSARVAPAAHPHVADNWNLKIEGYPDRIVLDEDTLEKDIYFNTAAPAAGSPITATIEQTPILRLDAPISVGASAPAELVAKLPDHVSRAGTTITWDAAGGEEIVIRLDPDTSGFRTEDVYCVAADTGSFTIPAEQLAQLSPGTENVELSVRRRASGKGRSEVRSFEVDLFVASAIYGLVPLVP